MASTVDQVTFRHASLEGVSHKYNCLLIPKAQHFSTFEFKARERRYKNSIIFAGIFFFFFSFFHEKGQRTINVVTTTLT